ncbi:MAG TPA: indole-3-glycerol phosphate synthase TrpC [Gemmatimonadota bacterium]|nr:indole-3-glycerol phosphate synthase TrpC [Gemmatimonadota bacterium]
MPKVNPPSGFLAGALARKRTEVERARRRRSGAELERLATERPSARSLADALRGQGVSVIAEVKRGSPSAGALDAGIDAPARARLYEERGAQAISVLTDAEFDGRLADLEAVAPAVSVPVLRKDFLVDPWQVWESRAAGADAALLIVAALDRSALDALVAESAGAGLGLLIEIHGRAEARAAIDTGASVIGVNARDLSTLAVDADAALSTIEWLRREASDAVIVAESGIADPEAVRRARDAGADAVLVGEHLSRATDPGDALERLVAAGREAGRSG